MYSSRRESRTCRWIEASLQNVYDDHRNDAKQNHSIYPDFEATLYEAVGLSKASKARRIVCLMELCRVLDVELPEDDGPHLTQEEKLRILNERLCERLRPSFVGSRVRKNINRFPMRVLKAAMHILGEVAVMALNDEWWYIKHHDSDIWKAIPKNITQLLTKWDVRVSEWANRSVHHRRLLNKVDKQIVNKCIFHLFIDYAVEGIISGVSTASHHLHEWSKPKRHRTLARDTIAKILYTVRIEMAPAAVKRTTTTPRAKGGSKVKTPSVVKPSSWTTFKNAVSKTVKRVMKRAGPNHTKRAVHESAKTLRLRTELRKCARKSNTRSSATGTYLFLSALLAAALTLIAARVAKKRGEDKGETGQEQEEGNSKDTDNGKSKEPWKRQKVTGHVDAMTTYAPAPSPLPTCQLYNDSTQPSKKTDALTHASLTPLDWSSDEFRSILAQIQQSTGPSVQGGVMAHSQGVAMGHASARANNQLWYTPQHTPSVPPGSHAPTVVNVFRCHNATMQQAYTAQKRQMGQHANERKGLFHGTKEDAVYAVLEEGYRKECNKRSSFGHGTYFARDASYSLSGYAPLTKNADQYLLVNDVLVGSMDHRSGRRVSPLVDTTVDSTLHPTIFCVHQNDRAIPRYLVHMNASVAKARANYKTFMSDTLPALLTTQELDRRIRESSLGVRGWAGEGVARCGS